MDKNKITFGFKNVHVAFITEGETGPSWDTPIRIPGAVRWAPTPEGESSTFYADDGSYFVATANNGYTGELEMALVPDEILARMLGWEIDDNGMVVEVANGNPEKFALLGEVNGDKRNRRFVYYDCQAQRPSKEKNTKGETIEPSTDVLSMTVSPLDIAGKVLVKGDIELNETNQTVFNSFFESVYTPTFGAGATGGEGGEV
ncbi:phage tail protein [Alkalicella caledoniensis]|uniref:Phage tail protein n=1 Tax=Alkalicella caledoniensis TaxID=2731377 RepID=A0A7G9W8B1_ALKCA|nr:major tail protein [Alkalicella caledoniensis]QNO14923.1 phage tail protein [Alkalicella caledoniensis]